MKKLTTFIAILALFALPVATAAAQVGNSGTDEYTETFPGAGGNKPSGADGGSGGSGAAGGGPLTPAQVAALESEGADGAAAADLAQSTGPDAKGGSERGGSAAGGDEPASDASGSGLPGAIGDLASGDDESGMGVLLPIILAVVLIGAIAFLVARRVRGRAGPA